MGLLNYDTSQETQVREEIPFYGTLYETLIYSHNSWGGDGDLIKQGEEEFLSCAIKCFDVVFKHFHKASISKFCKQNNE